MTNKEDNKTCFGTHEFNKNSGICKNCKEYKDCKTKNEIKIHMKGGK